MNKKKRITTPVREAALKWWNGLNAAGKQYKVERHSNLIAGEDRHYKTLTGLEIERIYEQCNRATTSSHSII